MLKNLGAAFILTTAMLFVIAYCQDRAHRVPCLGLANVFTFWAICLIRSKSK